MNTVSFPALGQVATINRGSTDVGKLLPRSETRAHTAIALLEQIRLPALFHATNWPKCSAQIVKRLVDEHRQACFDERTGTIRDAPPLIRGDDNGVHASDGIHRVAHAMRDARRLSDCLGIAGPITPNMGDFCSL